MKLICYRIEIETQSPLYTDNSKCVNQYTKQLEILINSPLIKWHLCSRYVTSVGSSVTSRPPPCIRIKQTLVSPWWCCTRRVRALWTMDAKNGVT
ncbi:hypothetical protein L1887_28466 [Cichorium endivia]|nr:hypothetical protein L1887_28466 [Cichorium endivia]